MEIIPESKNLEKILSGLETSYVVPDYQRDYSWSPNEVETLWVDLNNAHDQSSEYFMGTIVLKKNDTKDDLFDIVDGQQRLATFSILFAVIVSISKAFPSYPEIFKDTPRNKENLEKANRITTIAINRLREASEPDNYFLKLNKKDNLCFQHIVRNLDDVLHSDEQLRINKSDKRLIKTKKTFFSLIKDTITGDDAISKLNSLLVHMVKKLKFITIEVKTDYDAFLLFESLNSKGMDLSVSDLVKNKILMKSAGDEEQSDRLLANWDDMINLVESSRLSPVDFLRVYWEAIRGINTTKKELYKYISKYIDSKNIDVDSFSGDLLEKASQFSEYAAENLAFPECKHNKEKYLGFCGEINTMKYTTCYPLIMYTINNRPEFLEEITRVSLSFLFRWITIGDYSVGGAKKVFDSVIREMKKEEATLNDVLMPFYSHKDKIGDDAFIEAMKKFKTQDNQLAKYILSKFYIWHANGESIPNYSEVHLEHVIPQQPELWKKEGVFHPSEGTQINDFIYCIGNMTLLNKSINQSIKNKVFIDKVIEYKGSVFPETKKIYEKFNSGQMWSVAWIVERGEMIANAAPKIWML
ncbi:DUF262 domain-containing HNH endonuclease family protein [Aeromonas jandaei]|uniref:DUF262 domain-containing protein n=1 Tax=Aeromonas jandaei TaxID=650 RepID=UPI00227C400B|nr:DUF262 domain-containing HNH endonuclease family protein [Aeromonas jandaei]WAG07194.1 DUF262 domain-containing HNH endonuclease family protein [Aeromonas jandaei]